VRDVSIATLAWMLPGDTRHLPDVLLGELLQELLFGHAGAPLRHAIESSGLGRALGYSGFGNDGVDPTFMVSLKGLDPAHYDRFEPLVLDALRAIRDTGFGEEAIAAALHQLELDRRTISGDRFPFGLELAVGRVTEAWRQGTDPYEWLDDEAAMTALRERVAAPGFWSELLDRWFLDNPHRVLLQTEADPNFNQRRDEAERERVLAQVDALGETTLAVVLEQAHALKERQDEEDDVSVLPELMLGDVPTDTYWVEGEALAPGLDAFVTGTNGILHQVAALPLGELDQRERDLLPLLVGSLGKLGVGKMGYTDWAAHLNAVCGGLSAWADLRADAEDPSQSRGFLFLETRGLARKADAFSDLLVRTLSEQRFDEHARMLELVQQGVVSYQQQVNWGGNVLAQKAAMRGFGGRAGLEHSFAGLGRLAWLKDLAAGAADSLDSIAAVAEEMRALLMKLAAGPVRLALIGDAAASTAPRTALESAWRGWDRPASFAADATLTPLPGPTDTAHRAYTTATQVNYCAMAFPAVPLRHADAAPLTVAARYLANNWLHTRIREKGGAYGSRAAYAGGMSAFTINSYRDPRLAETYADFETGLRRLTTVPDDERLLREAVLGTIAGIDRPRSPSGEGRRRFVSDLLGYGPEVVDTYRAQVLDVSMDDLRRVADTHLDPERASRAVLTSEANLEASELGWESEPIA
jgi:Zn-dependent M16 (insulinase) family peptidase